ncbi:MAG: hypothetical protein WC728_16995 [Elusimicrobiota bacterium]
MKTMRGWLRCMLAAALAVAVAGGAATAADTDTDSLTISITPSVDLGVDLDTTSAKMTGSATNDLNLANVLLGSTVYMDIPAMMTIKGNFNRQEVRVSAAGLDTWQVDEDETIEADKVQVYALFTLGLPNANSPAEADFGSDGARHLVHAVGTSHVAGEDLGFEANLRTNNYYEIANGGITGGVEMDDLMVNTQRQLWLRVDTPADSSVDETQAQRIQVTVTALNGRTL